MNIKRLISISLLIFVVFSVGFLVHKEFIRWSPKKVNDIIEIQAPDTSLAQEPTIADIDTVANELPAKSQKPETTKIDLEEEKIPLIQPTPQANKSKVIAYYFHGTHRCPTCLTIERYSREAIEQYFTQELHDRKLEFRPLNVDEPRNRHYIQDYQLYFPTLIIAFYENNRQVDYKNLMDVWSYVRDREEFYRYVKNEVEKFLQETK